jgi:Subtilase family
VTTLNRRISIAKRKRVGVLLVCVVVSSPVTPLAKFRKIDRQRLIAAKLDGKKFETILIASKPRQNATVVRQLVGLGAYVRFREDTVDYLRVKAPIDSVFEITQLRGVEVAAIDGRQMYDTTQDSPAKLRTQTAAPDANTQPENPFLPTQDIGAPQFIRDHPTFDGRGVTIANLDGDTPDILSPELQRATTLDGRPIQKLTNVINTLDPEDDESPFKVDMSNEVEVQHGRFEFMGVTYKVALSDGRYRFGFFVRRERDRFAVLWDERTNSVWVDANQDQSFLNETRLTDFNESHQPGVFGYDNPATPVREALAFIILTDAEHRQLYLQPLANRHTTVTASVAAGSGFFGGRMNGVAPGAQIASLLRMSVTHSLIEGMILAVKNPKIDLVSLQWSALMPPQDGNSIVGVVFQRLVEKYKKPIFASADNLGPGIATNTEAAAADSVISVGGYISKSTWQSNFGIITAENGLVNLSARGPRADGGFKPDVVAPAAAVAATFGASSQTGTPFQLPAGYSSGLGTSIACPMASGAAALLISAAKQTGAPYDAERIRWALRSTARYLPGIGAYEQGSGLIDVAAAWEALKRAPAPLRIKSSTQINAGSALTHGPGIYEREGWRPGQTGQRTITFTRSSGKGEPVNYYVRWTGNDGTFSSASNIRLPLNVPVSLSVTINAQTPGAHSAILNLDEYSGGKSIYQVMNTVVAADQFTQRENYTITRDGSVEYAGYTSYFFNVPFNTSAFKVEANIHEGTLRLRFMRPSGKELDQAHDVPVRWLPEYQTRGRIDRVISDPEPGVWQVIVENQDLIAPGELTSKAQHGRFTLTSSVFGAETETSLTKLSVARTEQRQVRFINNFARFNGDYVAAPLGSAFSNRLSITQGEEPIVYEVDVPPGANMLMASIAGQSSARADVDLYLYFCAGNHCELEAYSTRSGTEERVRVSQPNAGRWKVVIDPVLIPSGMVTVDYTDVFTHSAFGSLTPLRGSASFSGSSSSNVNVAIKMGAGSTQNRRIVGLLQLMGREPATVRYEYSVATKRVEAVKERISLGEALLELGPGLRKLKPLTSSSSAMQ